MNTSQRPTATSEHVHAPYNFVPKSPFVFEPYWVKAISHDLPFKDGLSGVIPFRLVAATPLLVGGKRKKATERQAGSVEFCRLPDNRDSYFIPGSSLRGMIRNVLEIASFSRMKAVDNRRFSLRDLSGGREAGGMFNHYMDRMRADPKQGFAFHAGWLRYDTAHARWVITPCQYGRIAASQIGIRNPGEFQHKPAPAKYAAVRSSMRGRGLNERLEGYFRIISDGEPDLRRLEIAENETRGAFPATLVLTGQPNPKKTKEFVFYKEDVANPLEVSPDVMQDFRDIHETAAASADPFSAKQRDGGGDEARSTWDYFKGSDRIPVFFHTRSNRVVSLGLARMYKVPSRRSVHDLLGKEHLDNAKLDLAEAVFGRIAAADLPDPEPGNPAVTGLKGRVSFGHAVLATNVTAETRPQPAAILSTPKPSFVPSYLVQPRGNEATGEMNPRENYSSYEDDATLRGWKRYPVRPPAAARKPPPLPPALAGKLSQQTVLNTLPEGVVFSGELRVHNLRPAELGALLWAVTWGGNAELAHALGMGKPFGFGQVRFKLDPEQVRAGLSRADGEPAPTLGDLLSAFEQMMDTFFRAKDLQDKGSPIGWKDSDQIVALTAMADPRKVDVIEVNGTAVAKGPAGWLESMPLPDFAAKKGAKGNTPRFLRPYAPQRHSGVHAVGRRAASPTTTASGQSPAQTAPNRAVPVSGGILFAARTKIYADGELATVLDDVTEEMVRTKARVRIDYGDNDVVRVGAHLIKRA